MRDTRLRDVRLRGSVANVLARVFRQQSRLYNRALKPLGLSSMQAHILMVLWLEGPMTIGELQATLAISSATITGAADRMEKSELLRRVPVPLIRYFYLTG